jgi:hypothetical protein
MKTHEKSQLILLWVNANKNSGALSFNDMSTLKKLLSKQVKKHGYQDLIQYLDIHVSKYIELFQ